MPSSTPTKSILLCASLAMTACGDSPDSRGVVTRQDEVNVYLSDPEDPTLQLCLARSGIGLALEVGDQIHFRINSLLLGEESQQRCFGKDQVLITQLEDRGDPQKMTCTERLRQGNHAFVLGSARIENEPLSAHLLAEGSNDGIDWEFEVDHRNLANPTYNNECDATNSIGICLKDFTYPSLPIYSSLIDFSFYQEDDDGLQDLISDRFISVVYSGIDHRGEIKEVMINFDDCYVEMDESF